MPVSLRLIVLLLVGLIATGCDRQKAEAPQAPPVEAAQSKGVDRGHKGTPVPVASFHNPDGGPITLASFAGVPVLVNLWASWCGPCIKELPTLERLESEQARDGKLAVIAVSQDDGSQATVDAFLGARKIGRFAAFHDPDMALMSALGVEVLPTTILYDAAGKEVWRYTGDMDWTSAEARALVAEATNVPG